MMYLLVSQSVPAATPRPDNSAITALQSANAKVKWDKKNAIVADITGDGIVDTIAVGYTAEAVWLGLVPGSKSRRPANPLVVELVMCRRLVHIALSPATCEGSVGRLLDCKVVKGAYEFAIIDDACDPYHFYWDTALKTLGWWRL